MCVQSQNVYDQHFSAIIGHWTLNPRWLLDKQLQVSVLWFMLIKTQNKILIKWIRVCMSAWWFVCVYGWVGATEYMSAWWFMCVCGWVGGTENISACVNVSMYVCVWGGGRVCVCVCEWWYRALLRQLLIYVALTYRPWFLCPCWITLVSWLL